MSLYFICANTEGAVFPLAPLVLANKKIGEICFLAQRAIPAFRLCDVQCLANIWRKDH
jgi:hypothetical protein